MDREVMIVPVSDHSFKKALNEKIYAVPMSYGIKRSPSYIAFYRVKPIMAITHYAKVKNMRTCPLEEFGAKDVVLMFGHRFGDIIVFELDDLIELKNPIKHKTKVMQGRKYTSLSILLSARVTDDV